MDDNSEALVFCTISMVFSGIVEGVGEVVGVRPMVKNKPSHGIIVEVGAVRIEVNTRYFEKLSIEVVRSVPLQIRSRVACSDAYIGCSIAVEGVCLTVTEINTDVFTVGISPETLMKTTLGGLTPGSKV